VGQQQKKCLLTETAIWDIFWQLCLAVLHLHSHNVIHRDIKPLNILLTTDAQHKKVVKVLWKRRPFRSSRTWGTRAFFQRLN
jgi:serine/threonine protein kinase